MNEMKSLTEQQLIKLALVGDNDGLNHLLARSQPRIFQQIRSQISDEAMAHDLCQEVNIKIFRYLPYFKGHCSFTTWLYRIIQNTIKNYFRATKNEFVQNLEIMPFMELEDRTHTPESYLISLQLEQQVEALLINMSWELQVCFNLYLINELSYQEIALHLNCPLGTVRSRIHRLRNLLAENIQVKQ